MASTLRVEIQERLDAQGLAISPAVVDGCAEYVALLARWNRRINLTSLPLDAPIPAKTIDRLIVEPLCAADWLTDGDRRWVDLGSGGGSPALPLRLASPSGTLAMVEARARKCAFLREAVRVLQLPRTEVLATRFEDLSFGRDIDLITLRAVRLDADLADLVRGWLGPEGKVLSFGGSPVEGMVVVRRKALPDGSWLEEMAVR
jgi:16S rRNA (guanine527-N7)-methyltransferase